MAGRRTNYETDAAPLTLEPLDISDRVNTRPRRVAVSIPDEIKSIAQRLADLEGEVERKAALRNAALASMKDELRVLEGNASSSWCCDATNTGCLRPRPGTWPAEHLRWHCSNGCDYDICEKCHASEHGHEHELELVGDASLSALRQQLARDELDLATTCASEREEFRPLRVELVTLIVQDRSLAETPLVHVSMANEYLAQGRYGEAIALFDAALASGLDGSESEKARDGLSLAYHGASYRPVLAAVSETSRTTQRRAFLTTMAECIGPRIADDAAMEKFRDVLLLSDRLVGGSKSNILFNSSRDNQQLILHYLHTYRDGLLNKQIQGMVQNGWPDQDALITTLLLDLGAVAIGNVVSEGIKELATPVHALHDAISSNGARQTFVAPPLYLPARGFPNRDLPFGLFDFEPQCSTIEEPDATGSRSINCNAPLSLQDDVRSITQWGCYLQDTSGAWVLTDGDVVCIRSRPNDHLCCRTAVLYHDGQLPTYVLPPNTLLTLEEISEPPFEATFLRWHKYRHESGNMIVVDRRETVADPQTGHQAPTKYLLAQMGGREQYKNITPGHPRARDFFDDVGYTPSETFARTVHGRRLLTLTAAFVLPPVTSIRKHSDSFAAEADIKEREQATSKYGDNVVTLSFLDRLAYKRGTEELTNDLEHTLRAEWERNTTAWRDWAGAEYTGEEQLHYVLGPAFSVQGTPGTRDANNIGLLLDGFVQRGNEHIQVRAAAMGIAQPQLLTRDEVIAIRLYTGPGYQPINGWLREVAMLGQSPPAWFVPRWGAWSSQRAKMDPSAARRDAALDAASSFGVTVGALTSAIRKLAAVNTAAENRRTLYRGLKGTLQGSFWLPDELGIVCATDAAFMSTSLGESTPIHYMDAEQMPNVLWELRAREGDDLGLHCGAEVAMFSQFEAEREVLFPPLTMLRVLLRQGGSRHPAPLASSPVVDHISYSRARHEVKSEMHIGSEAKHFERVVVVPTFT